MDLKRSLEATYEHEWDSEYGVKESVAGEALVFLRDYIVEFSEELIDIVDEQADWEFKNNPDKPELSNLCRNISEAMRIKLNNLRVDIAKSKTR